MLKRGIMYKLCSLGWLQVTGQIRRKKEKERHSLNMLKQSRRRVVLKALSRLSVKSVAWPCSTCNSVLCVVLQLCS